MAKVNREWHDSNRLPRRATTKVRVKWHLSHAKACGCRPMPAKIQRSIEKLEVDRTKKVTKNTKSTKKPASKKSTKEK